MASSERYLVTGAYGCIGAWVIRELLDQRAFVAAFDVAGDSPRLSLIVDEPQRQHLVRVQGDITDLGAVERAIDENSITRVIHLAALQVPFCRANPPAGAAVNVVGTANLLAACRVSAVPRIVYASSSSVYGPAAGRPSAPGDPLCHVESVYAATKVAGEVPRRCFKRCLCHSDRGSVNFGRSVIVLRTSLPDTKIRSPIRSLDIVDKILYKYYFIHSINYLKTYKKSITNVYK